VPTDLPDSKRRNPHPVRAAAAPKQTAFAKLLNTFMIGSVLVLFALVLLQEKRYADGEAGTVADAFIQKAQAAVGAEDGASPN
jgi:hypothetical protein